MKINFYKFIWCSGKLKKMYIYKYFFWVFSNSKLCEKKMVQELNGHYVTIQALYCDMVVLECSFGLGKCILIRKLYCKRVQVGWKNCIAMGRNCIVIGGCLSGWRVCHNTVIVL